MFSLSLSLSLSSAHCSTCRSSVPILYVDGVAACGQSKAIERYLAREFGLMGEGELEAAQVDCVGEHVRDIKDKYAKAKAAGDADKWLAEELSVQLGKLESVVAITSKAPGCAVGSKLSLAGLQIYMLCCDHFDAKETVAAAFKAQPKLQAIVDAVAGNEKIKAWQAARKVTPF